MSVTVSCHALWNDPPSPHRILASTFQHCGHRTLSASRDFFFGWLRPYNNIIWIQDGKLSHWFLLHEIIIPHCPGSRRGMNSTSHFSEETFVTAKGPGPVRSGNCSCSALIRLTCMSRHMYSIHCASTLVRVAFTGENTPKLRRDRVHSEVEFAVVSVSKFHWREPPKTTHQRDKSFL